MVFLVASTAKKITMLTAALAEVLVPVTGFLYITKEFTGHPFYGIGYGRSGLDLEPATVMMKVATC